MGTRSYFFDKNIFTYTLKYSTEQKVTENIKTSFTVFVWTSKLKFAVGANNFCYFKKEQKSYNQFNS